MAKKNTDWIGNQYAVKNHYYIDGHVFIRKIFFLVTEFIKSLHVTRLT